MSNYISDFSKTHWMVSNPARVARTGMDGKSFRCPFCEGNESDTPPEIYRVGDSEVNKPGWKIRVFANLFPITEIHEVVVHSPDHEKNIEDFSTEHVENLIKTYINRFNFLKDKGKVFIFHNYSLISGASLEHPHSQITVVPNDIPTDSLAVQPVANIIEQVGEFISYCPEYSEWSYEVWITLKQDLENVGVGRDRPLEDLNENQVKNLAKILQSTILKLKKIHANNPHYSKKPFGYNFYFSIPQSGLGDVNFITRESHQPKSAGPLESLPAGRQVKNISSAITYNWYLRIIPRFMERAGFELATGIMVNSVEAKRASEELKKV